METWRPECLPSYFEPRPRRGGLDAPWPTWSLAAAGVGALLLLGFAVVRPTGMTSAVQYITSTATHLAPAPAPAPAAPTVVPAPPAPPSSAATPAPSPTAEPTPNVQLSGLRPSLAVTPGPAQSADSSPSPSGLCVPLNLLCI